MKDMTKGGEAWLIFAFSIPMLVGNIFQQAYSIIDGIVVGQYNGPDALAAVGTSFPILFLILALILGLTMGAGILISQLFGAKNYEGVRRATTSILIITTIGCIALSVIGYFATPFLLKTILGVPDNILKDSTTFLQIYFAGLIFVYLYNMVAGLLRAVGDSKTPLYFLIISTIINIVLDLYFVPVLKLGVAGVAYATLIAQGFSAVISIIYVYWKVPLFRFKLNEFVFDRELSETAIRLGVPSSIQQFVLALGFVAVQRLVNGFGETTMAAFTAAMRIDQLATIPIMTIGMALATFAGQNIGAGRMDRVATGYKKTLLISAAGCILMTGVIFLFGNDLIRMFIGGKAGNEGVLRQGAEYLRVVVCFYLLFSVMNNTSSLLRGCGDVMFSTLITLLAFGVRLAAAYALAPVISYRAIWWSIPAGWVLSMILAVFRYRSGKWKEKAVVKHGSDECEGGGECPECPA